MSVKGFIKFALLAAHILGALASPIENVRLITCIPAHLLIIVFGTEQRADDELVQTPAGLVPKSNVHAVPEGARVHQSPSEVQIIASNGTVIHSRPFTKSAGPLKKPPSSNLARRTLQSGYVAYAYWENTGSQPIAFFGTNWNVPPTPSSWDGQLLYWFNGLVPGDFNGILQPVLQYGTSPAGGGQYYAIASWWLIGNNVYHSSIQQVSPGTALEGHMALTGISTSGGVTTYSYSSYFPGYSTPSISASTTGVLNWAYEALEIYTTASTSDLPSGSTDLTAVDIKFNDNSHLSTIPWTAISDTTDGISMSVISNSGTNGHLRITY
ncbi:hypothetical protein CVT26_002957 [Gymnopilus dilepis]|uniref:Uncharacterized protein n=1 Tax=Gymnopilus dilepis TaxID=231916 RepID=A0A409VQZ4_9AGAR|nr:hypothetical protein CVT26_002957 [Gymnopilus dilepis]